MMEVRAGRLPQQTVWLQRKIRSEFADLRCDLVPHH